ncbi:hypothetical protein EUX98_g8195 [Antrodiella citrinella]|uniref:Uncharacterized protein n=1 Tax=Antrodiella citrinella TaxID=2447956 RepID=A0A4S4MAN6_9APHY|nr:hypothetical protein EUX98_g8195 [Antrodiella citrinella]
MDPVNSSIKQLENAYECSISQVSHLLNSRLSFRNIRGDARTRNALGRDTLQRTERELRAAGLFAGGIATSVAASTLALDDDQFTTWGSYVGLSVQEPASPDDIPGVEKMLRKEDIEYPDLTGLEDTEVPDIGDSRTSIADIKKWSAKLPNNCQRMSRELSRYYLTCMLPLYDDAASSREFPTNEACQRTAVDSLIHLAFSEHNKALRVRMEVPVALPRRADRSRGFGPANAVADVLVLHTLSDEPSEENEPVYVLEQAHFIFRSSFRMDPLVLGFLPVEHKFNEVQQAIHEVAMYSSSILHQRRALGLPDRLVYGATCVGLEFTIVVTTWSTSDPASQVIDVYPTEYHWFLNRPAQMMECFCYLRSLAKMFGDAIKADLPEGFRLSVPRRWRYEHREMKRRIKKNAAGGSEGGGGGGGGGGSDGGRDEKRGKKRKASEASNDAGNDDTMVADEPMAEDETTTLDEDRFRLEQILTNRDPSQARVSIVVPLLERMIKRLRAKQEEITKWRDNVPLITEPDPLDDFEPQMDPGFGV